MTLFNYLFIDHFYQLLVHNHNETFVKLLDFIDKELNQVQFDIKVMEIFTVQEVSQRTK